MFRTQEYEPRTLRNAHQIATVVNLTRTALMHTDAIARVSLLKTLADEEDVSILIREPGDRIVPFGNTGLENRLVQEMVERLGPGTLIASSVNDASGLWVGFEIERDSYWLQMDAERLQPLGGTAWLNWLGVTLALSLAGAAMVAGLMRDIGVQQVGVADTIGVGTPSQVQAALEAALTHFHIDAVIGHFHDT
jgi:two-component system osmolarity sensor histidine kinase EnvZ